VNGKQTQTDINSPANGKLNIFAKLTHSK